MRLRVSVCMTVYNGKEFISDQIFSVLSQLCDHDELVIVDDFSSDESVAIIEQFQDKRLKLFRNSENIGVIRSFERVIALSTGDLIFLCDQDDVWYPDKVTSIIDIFQKSRASCIICDANIIDQSNEIIDNSFFKMFNSGSGVWKNFKKNTYLGCCMAFDARAKAWLLPFPRQIPIHDHWMGLVLNAIGGVYFLPKPLMGYRRHGGNVTSLSRFGLPRVIKNRIQLLFALTRVPRLLIKRLLLGDWRLVK
jgi:glycosyltransferase involved in cell wall biosynthesis